MPVEEPPEIRWKKLRFVPVTPGATEGPSLITDVGQVLAGPDTGPPPPPWNLLQSDGETIQEWMVGLAFRPSTAPVWNGANAEVLIAIPIREADYDPGIQSGLVFQHRVANWQGTVREANLSGGSITFEGLPALTMWRRVSLRSPTNPTEPGQVGPNSFFDRDVTVRGIGFAGERFAGRIASTALGVWSATIMQVESFNFSNPPDGAAFFCFGMTNADFRAAAGGNSPEENSNYAYKIALKVRPPV